MRIEEPPVFGPIGFARIAVALVAQQVRRVPETVTIPAAAMIAAAAIWAVAQLLGISADTIDLRIAPVTVAAQTPGMGKAFCRAPPPAAGQTSITSAADWAFPLYACATGGIAGPTGPTELVPATAGRMVLETTAGGSAIYAVMMANTGSRTRPAASGAEFRDGYAFSPDFVANAGMSLTRLSNQCEAGFAPAPMSLADPAPYGEGQAVYAPGTPSVTPDGGFICGNTHIVGGDLDLPD